jgi:hypothetical protein
LSGFFFKFAIGAQMTILIPVIGLLTVTLVLFLLYPKQIKTGKLAALYSLDSART